MALQLDLTTTPVGIPLPEAYARIEFIRVLEKNVLISVKFYADAAARQADAQEIDQRSYQTSVASLSVGALNAPRDTGEVDADGNPILTAPDPALVIDNPLQNAYLWLKQHSDFKDALSV
tara:strand:- start:246 stop:605 length:360 start_codon:yes stop_codon:yes gene_type:complete